MKKEIKKETKQQNIKPNKLLLLVGCVVFAIIGVGIILLVYSNQNTSKIAQLEPKTDKTTYNVTVGQKFYTYTNEKPSVGIQAETPVYDAEILKLTETRTIDQSNGLMGGDSYRIEYYFEAIKQGESSITVEKNYRGEIDGNLIDISVVVK